MLLAIFGFLADAHDAGSPVATVIASTLGAGGTVGLGLKLLARHMDRLGAERRDERKADNTLINDQRTDFLAALDKLETRFIAALGAQEAACAKTRSEELKVIFRFAGLPYPGDTGRFRTQRPAAVEDAETADEKEKTP